MGRRLRVRNGRVESAEESAVSTRARSPPSHTDEDDEDEEDA